MNILSILSMYNIKLGYIDYIELSLWIILCGVLVFGCIAILMKYRKTQISLFSIYVIVCIFFLIATILRIYMKFFMGKPIEGNPYYPPDVLILLILVAIFNNISLFLLYFDLEKKQIKESHYAFSIMVWVLLTIIILEAITRDILIRIILIIMFIIVVAGLPFMYLYIGIKAKGNLRARALMIGIGIMLVCLSIAMDQPVGEIVFSGVHEIIRAIFVPTIYIIGMLLLIYGLGKAQ